MGDDTSKKFEARAIYTLGHENYDDEDVRAYRSAIGEMGDGAKAREIMASSNARIKHVRKMEIPSDPRACRREHAPTLIQNAMDTDLHFIPTLLGAHNLASMVILIPAYNYVLGGREASNKAKKREDKMKRLLTKVFGGDVVNKLHQLDPVLGQVIHMEVNGVNVFYAALVSGTKEQLISRTTSKVAVKTIAREISNLRSKLQERLAETKLTCTQRENIENNLEATKRVAISRAGNRDCSYTYSEFEEAFNEAVQEMETTPDARRAGYESVAKVFEVTVYSSWENPNSLIGLNEQTSRDGITTETSMIDYEASNHMRLLNEPKEYEKGHKSVARRARPNKA